MTAAGSLVGDDVRVHKRLVTNNFFSWDKKNCTYMGLKYPYLIANKVQWEKAITSNYKVHCKNFNQRYYICTIIHIVRLWFLAQISHLPGAFVNVFALHYISCSSSIALTILMNIF